MNYFEIGGEVTYSDPSPGAGAGTVSFAGRTATPQWSSGIFVTSLHLQYNVFTLGASSSGTLQGTVASSIGGGGETSASDPVAWINSEGASSTPVLDRSTYCRGKMFTGLANVSATVAVSITTGGDWLGLLCSLVVRGHPAAAGMIHT